MQSYGNRLVAIKPTKQRALARFAPLAGARALAARYLLDERGDVVGVGAGQQLRRHLALAARPSVRDRVEHERLRRAQLVEVRADLADRVGAVERVARRAVLGEQLAPLDLVGGQRDAAGPLLLVRA